MDDEKLLEFSDFGGYCQYDFFGLECSHFQMNLKIDMPSDAQRIEKLKILRDHGKLNQILMSHDIHTKHRLVKINRSQFNDKQF
jgi:phosphotriesterase-related protein